MDNRDAEFLDHLGSHDRDDVFGRGAVVALPLQGAFGYWTYLIFHLMTVSTEAIHRYFHGGGEVFATDKLWGFFARR